MAEDPEVVFAGTSEIAARLGSSVVIDAGIENAALELAVGETLFGETLNPIRPLSLLRFLTGIPF